MIFENNHTHMMSNSRRPSRSRLRSQGPWRFHLSEDTYITKRDDGQLIMVRDHDKGSIFDVGLDLLGEAFIGPNFGGVRRTSICATSDEGSEESGSDDQSSTASIKSTQPVPKGGQQEVTNITQQVLMPVISKTSNMAGDPPPGIYQQGSKQLALLPIGTQIAPKSQPPPPPTYPPPDHVHFAKPWTYQQAPPIAYAHGYQQAMMYAQQQQFGYPSYWPPPPPPPGALLPQPVMSGALAVANASSSSETEESKKMEAAKEPVCAGCGRTRSRKFQHDNPVKPGEAVVPSYCRKCQKVDTSEDSSDGEKEVKKQNKKRDEKQKSKKKREKKPMACGSIESYARKV